MVLSQTLTSDSLSSQILVSDSAFSREIIPVMFQQVLSFLNLRPLLGSWGFSYAYISNLFISPFLIIPFWKAGSHIF